MPKRKLRTTDHVKLRMHQRLDPMMVYYDYVGWYEYRIYHGDPEGLRQHAWIMGWKEEINASYAVSDALPVPPSSVTLRDPHVPGTRYRYCFSYEALFVIQGRSIVTCWRQDWVLMAADLLINTIFQEVI